MIHAKIITIKSHFPTTPVLPFYELGKLYEVLKVLTFLFVVVVVCLFVSVLIFLLLKELILSHDTSMYMKI